jgi:hypothetical protein
VCISWLIQSLILLMDGATMKITALWFIASVNTFIARFLQFRCSIYLLPTILLQASLLQHMKTIYRYNKRNNHYKLWCSSPAYCKVKNCLFSNTCLYSFRERVIVPGSRYIYLGLSKMKLTPSE